MNLAERILKRIRDAMSEACFMHASEEQQRRRSKFARLSEIKKMVDFCVASPQSASVHFRRRALKSPHFFDSKFILFASNAPRRKGIKI